MFRKIIVEGGLELYDKYHYIVVENIMNNAAWQEEGSTHFEAQFNSWWSFMNGDNIDDVISTWRKGMRNSQLPVFSRWQTIIPSIGAFIKNYTVIFLLRSPLFKRRRQAVTCTTTLAMSLA